MGSRPGRSDPSLALPRPDSAEARYAVVVAAVLDALPSPTVLIAAEGRASESAAAIAAVVGLGRAFGMRTLAEGVETAEQLATAVEQGCTFAQGYHIARPMPAEQLAAWMVERSAGRPPLPLLTDAAMAAGAVRSAAQLV